MVKRFEWYDNGMGELDRGEYVREQDYSDLQAERDTWKARFEGMEEERERECQRKIDALSALHNAIDERDAFQQRAMDVTRERNALAAQVRHLNTVIRVFEGTGNMPPVRAKE